MAESEHTLISIHIPVTWTAQSHLIYLNCILISIRQILQSIFNSERWIDPSFQMHDLRRKSQ